MLDGFGECDEVIFSCRVYWCVIVTRLLLFLFFRSADSLEEIVGLDISYHGGFRQRGVETESNHDEEESLYYQRREQLREKQRNKIRRRILMMDISLSRGRNSVSSAAEEKSNHDENHDDVENHDDDQGLPPLNRLTI